MYIAIPGIVCVLCVCVHYMYAKLTLSHPVREDVIMALNQAIDRCEEGLLVKHPGSTYRPDKRKGEFCQTLPSEEYCISLNMSRMRNNWLDQLVDVIRLHNPCSYFD